MRTYPDYGTPGAPNMDPYYLSPAEEREWEEEQARIEQQKAEERAADEAALAEDAAWLAANAEDMT